MDIVIDLDGSAPVRDQLIGQIRKAVLRERMFPGDALPSIQQLASDLEINRRTVADAYRVLERDSVIHTHGYRCASIHPSQLKRILRHGADQGWPTSLLNWMQGAGVTGSGPEPEAARSAESWK